MSGSIAATSPSEVESWVTHLRDHAHEKYTPISFWDDLDVYVEVATEKLDLRNLFAPVCVEFHVPITNFKGWSDLNSRAAMMRRFKEHEAEGRALRLAPVWRSRSRRPEHHRDDAQESGRPERRRRLVDPDNLEIIRFGLNADFIDQHGLTWIENLETSSGGQLDDPKHPDHDKSYVQDYIAEFGARKCEANALVVEPDVGRQLCRNAILEHVPGDAVERYQRNLDRARKRLRRALRERVA